MGLPVIQRCEVDPCFYNTGRMCHAPAITVGSSHPSCDAFIARPQHSPRSDSGLVGACHIADCAFNADLTCTATGIVVSLHAGHADCGTHRRKDEE